MCTAHGKGVTFLGSLATEWPTTRKSHPAELPFSMSKKRRLERGKSVCQRSGFGKPWSASRVSIFEKTCDMKISDILELPPPPRMPVTKKDYETFLGSGIPT